MCLCKSDIYQVSLPQIQIGVPINDDDLMCAEQLEAYKDRELAYLNKAFSALRIYKSGNIGPKELFFEHRFTVFGFINNKQGQTVDNIARNIVDATIYSLTDTEVDECNGLLARISTTEFTMLENMIREFISGLEQVDIPTGFEQFTTVLEMILLETNQRYKKEALARRVAVLLETDSQKIFDLYRKMKEYYRFRSESLHEGNGSNITAIELKELESIVRSVLKKYLDFCRTSVQIAPSSTWDQIKAAKIIEMKNLVRTLTTSGVLPTLPA